MKLLNILIESPKLTKEASQGPGSYLQDRLENLINTEEQSSAIRTILLVTVDSVRRNNNTRLWILDTRPSENSVLMMVLQRKELVSTIRYWDTKRLLIYIGLNEILLTIYKGDYA